MAGELDGPYESYCENGQLQEKGTYNMGQKCGEWIEDGETNHLRPLSPRRQLAPRHPGLEDDNQPPPVAPSHT